MLNIIKISAPGRIVLCGDIGAMFGKHVVLASLNCRTSVEFWEIPVEEKNIIIVFPDDNIYQSVPLEVISKFRSLNHFTTLISDHFGFATALESFITTNAIASSQRYNLNIFFFILMHIATYEELTIKPFRVHVSTQLPIGDDFGNSSSFALCLSACFIHWGFVQRNNYCPITEEKMNSILKYAKLAKNVLDSYTCDTDIDVCYHGKMINFKYDTEQDEYSIDKIDAPRINIMLVDLKIESKIGDRKRQIAETYSNRTTEMRKFLDKSNDLSIQICNMLQYIKNCYRDGLQHDETVSFSKLETLIQKYYGFLITLGLCEERLILLCTITHSVKNCVAMMASYENNFAYILLPPTIKPHQTTQLRRRLENENFDVINETNLSCEGLTIENECAKEV